MKNEKLIQKEAAKIFKVDENEIMVIEKLLGGMSHLTYKIKYQNDFYVIRVIGPGGHLYVDFYEEYQNILIVDKLGLNNKTIYFDTKTGTKLAIYEEGDVLTTIDFTKYLDCISKNLKILHHSGLKAYKQYEHVKRLEKYEKPLKKLDPKYIELKNIWIKKFNQEINQADFVFCHNDAQRSNMVIQGNKLFLLDWEYAAMNDIFYDIASFGNVDLNDSFLLLDNYLGRKATKDEINKVKFYRMYQGLQWHLVASHKENLGLSEILNFDFNVLAKNYLKLAEKLLNEIKM